MRERAQTREGKRKRERERARRREIQKTRARERDISKTQDGDTDRKTKESRRETNSATHENHKQSY